MSGCGGDYLFGVVCGGLSVGFPMLLWVIILIRRRGNVVG